MSRQSWTKIDDSFLREHYPLNDANYCAIHLSRSAQSIRARACKLGIKRQNNIAARLKVNNTYVDQIKNTQCRALENYAGAQEQILHECKICLHKWSATPTHILSGKGCPECGGTRKRTNEEHLQKLKTREDLISIGEYTGMDNKLEFKCTKCNYYWQAVPASIYRGSGCPKCARYGFDPSKPGILYLIEFPSEDGSIFKLGITNRTAYRRHSTDIKYLDGKICWELEFKLGEDARLIESSIKKEYVKFQINTGLLRSGNTETFSCYIPKPEIINVNSIKV